VKLNETWDFVVVLNACRLRVEEGSKLSQLKKINLIRRLEIMSEDVSVSASAMSEVKEM